MDRKSDIYRRVPYLKIMLSINISFFKRVSWSIKCTSVSKLNFKTGILDLILILAYFEQASDKGGVILFPQP